MDAVTGHIVSRIRQDVAEARGALARYQMLVHEDDGLKTATERLSSVLNDIAALERRLFGGVG